MEIKEQLEILCKCIDDLNGKDIVVLDFREKSPFYDYFILATASSNRNAAAIIRELEDKAYDLEMDVRFSETDAESSWLVIDMGTIIAHIFLPEARKLYNLEGLWKDLIV